MLLSGLKSWRKSIERRLNRTAGQPAKRRRRAARDLAAAPAAETLEERVMLSAGSLDSSFGGDGIVTDARGNEILGMEFETDAEGDLARYLVAGHANVDGDFAVAAYLPDGSPDGSFGTDGFVTTAVSKDTDKATSMALQGDGKIVVGGWSDTAGSPWEEDAAFTLARYTADGSLDETFGDKGIAITDSGDLIRDIAIQDDGKIIALGAVRDHETAEVALARYNSDGTFDTTFSDDGMLVEDLGGMDEARGVAIQSDGKIVVAGHTDVNDSGDFMLIRYNPDGTRDGTFGQDGVVLTNVVSPEGGSGSTARDVTLQDDGKIVVAGTTEGAVSVARYNSDGSLDGAFGSDLDGDGSPDGFTFTDVSGQSLRARSVAVNSNTGKIVAAGEVIAGGSGVLTVRYDSSGTLDTSYDGDGIVTTDISDNAERGHDVAIQPDGKIMVAGSHFTDKLEFAMVRYHGDPPPIAISIDDVSVTEGDSGIVDATFTVSLSRESTETITVDYATQDDTATTADNDYDAASGTLTFDPGVTSLTVSVTVNGDTTEESDEAFFVNLSNVTGDATIADDQGVGTILDDDGPAGGGMYVWDIAFESRTRGKGGKFHDEKIHTTVQNDSDGDGADSGDDPVANASVTVDLWQDADGDGTLESADNLIGTFSGITDSSGVFSTDWLKDLPDGTYWAEVLDLTHGTYTWNGALDPTANDGDSDGDGLPDQQHTIPHSTTSSSLSLTSTDSGSTSDTDDEFGSSLTLASMEDEETSTSSGSGSEESGTDDAGSSTQPAGSDSADDGSTESAALDELFSELGHSTLSDPLLEPVA